MPLSGPVLAGAILAVVLLWGASKTVHAVKKAGHEIGCIVRHAHKCASK